MDGTLLQVNATSLRSKIRCHRERNTKSARALAGNILPVQVADRWKAVDVVVWAERPV